MSGGIYLIRDDDDFVEMTEQVYDSEDVLQDLLARYPSLLAGDQIDPERPRRWLLVTREMGLPSDESVGSRWAVDHLFVDQEGIPTLVEVKRSSDTRLRREVVGQLLEYAANAVVYWPLERIVDAFEAECERERLDPQEQLATLIGGETDVEAFWERVRTNLQAGRVRLVFVADVIPRELRRIVEFLNEQMSPTDVFAVEVKQFAGGDSKALVPRLIGATERKTTPSPRATRRWDEESFFDDLAANNPARIVSLVRELLEELHGLGGVEVAWGGGTTTASFTPTMNHRGRAHRLFRVISLGGRVELYFGDLKKQPPFDDIEMRKKLRRRYNEIPGVNVPEDRIDRYPSVLLEDLASTDVLAQFLDVQRWTIEEIRKT